MADDVGSLARDLHAVVETCLLSLVKPTAVDAVLSVLKSMGYDVRLDRHDANHVTATVIGEDGATATRVLAADAIRDAVAIALHGKAADDEPEND